MRIFMCSLVLAALPLRLDAQIEETRHVLAFPERLNQYVQVRSSFPVSGERVELAMPSWNPGSYLIRDYAAQLENLVVSGASGQVLAARKTAKNSWKVEVGGETEITVEYRVWAGQLNVSTSWVENDAALINGAGVFMYTGSSRGAPQQLEIILPPAWGTLHTSLEPAAEPRTWRAQNFDELIDSPILAGNAQSYDFHVDGQAYALVFSSENRFWDGARSRDDIEKLVGAHQAFWGSNPFNAKYHFLNVFMGPFGGLEHDHSTVIMIDPLQMREPGDYVKWLAVISHEFFHAWNVRRMRPEALANYDFDQENYTRELWLAEGLTSYYDNLLLFRSGLIDVSEYLELLAREIRTYETTPGRRVRSAELASFDTWVKHYKQDGNSINSTVSYYRKGSLIGLASDMAIRRKTSGKSSLDTVMRTMFERFGAAEQGGYPAGAFEDIVEELAGAEVREALDGWLQTTADPPVDEALEWYGLLLDRSPELTTGGDVPAGLGVVWDEDGPRLMAAQVLHGHAGAIAGLLPGDEMIAVGGIRVTPLNYGAVMNRLLVGEKVDLLVARHDRTLTLEAELQAALPEIYRISPNPDIGGRQKRRLENWLGRDLVFSRR